MKTVLEVKNFSCGYPKKNVIKNVSFTIKEGEFVGLIGLNASGKSTLIKGLCKSIKTSGKVLCCGQETERMSNKEIAKHVGYIAQRPSITSPLTVSEVVLMGLNPILKLLEYPNNAQKQKAKEILNSVGLQGFYDKNYLLLSEGQRQLVLLARLILQNPKLLLLDEPDSALDFNNRHQMLTIIKNLVEKEGKSALYCMHDINFALEYCDKIIMIKEGTISSIFKTSLITDNELKNELSNIYGKVDVVTVANKRLMIRKN